MQASRMNTDENMTVQKDFTISKKFNGGGAIEKERALTEEGSLAIFIDDYAKDGAHHSRDNVGQSVEGTGRFSKTESILKHV